MKFRNSLLLLLAFFLVFCFIHPHVVDCAQHQNPYSYEDYDDDSDTGLMSIRNLYNTLVVYTSDIFNSWSDMFINHEDPLSYDPKFKELNKKASAITAIIEPYKYIFILMVLSLIKIIDMCQLVSILMFLPYPTQREQKAMILALLISLLTSNFSYFILTLLGSLVFWKLVLPNSPIRYSSITEIIGDLFDDLPFSNFIKTSLCENTFGIRMFYMLYCYIFLVIFVSIGHLFLGSNAFVDVNLYQRSSKLKNMSSNEGSSSIVQLLNVQSESAEEPVLISSTPILGKEPTSFGFKPAHIVCSLFAAIVPIFLLVI